jgi:hypothetical protein
VCIFAPVRRKVSNQKPAPAAMYCMSSALQQRPNRNPEPWARDHGLTDSGGTRQIESILTTGLEFCVPEIVRYWETSLSLPFSYLLIPRITYPYLKWLA